MLKGKINKTTIKEIKRKTQTKTQKQMAQQKQQQKKKERKKKKDKTNEICFYLLFYFKLFLLILSNLFFFLLWENVKKHGKKKDIWKKKVYSNLKRWKIIRNYNKIFQTL